MDKKDIKNVSAALRTQFQRAMDSSRKNNRDYAVGQLKEIVKKSPGFMAARDELRRLEKEKNKPISGIPAYMLSLKSFFKAMKIKSLSKKKPLEAMAMAEDVLAEFVYNPTILNALAVAAANADALFISLESLELIRGITPNKESNLRKLAEVYKRLGEGTKVLQIFQQIAAKHPGDLGVEAELRSAAALASLQEGNWEKEGDYHDKLKDQGEALSLDKEDRVLHNEDDLQAQIERYEKELETDLESLEKRRRLVEIYQRAGKHEEAIRVLNFIVAKSESMDPAIDRMIEKSQVALYDNEIERLAGGGASEQEIQETRNNIYNYRLGKAVERVNNFPNDTQLRYDLALRYFEGNHFDNAVEQFQYARRNPQRKISSIIYLGRCFIAKEQYDLAEEQFADAIGQIQVMNKEKTEALYFQGIVCEKMGKVDKAAECFKDIYQHDMNYLDVAERIKKLYEVKTPADVK